MQIQIKQSEIITAIKQYVSQQGISLQNKQVTVSFIAGRKGSGISADVVIEDSSIPGFEDTVAEEETKAPTQGVVVNITEAKKEEEIVKSTDEPTPTTEAEAAPGKSLFT